MNLETLSIYLPQEMAELVRNEVASGAYASDSDLVQDALRLWHERAGRLRIIRQSLEEAAADPAPIPSNKLRTHFETRFAALQAKQV